MFEVWDIQHRKVKFLFQKCDNILLLTRLVVGSFLKVLLLYLLSMFTCLSCGLMTSDTTLTEAPGGWRLTGEDRTVNTWSGPLTQEEATSLSTETRLQYYTIQTIQLVIWKGFLEFLNKMTVTSFPWYPGDFIAVAQNCVIPRQSIKWLNKHIYYRQFVSNFPATWTMEHGIRLAVNG